MDIEHLEQLEKRYENAKEFLLDDAHWLIGHWYKNKDVWLTDRCLSETELQKLIGVQEIVNSTVNMFDHLLKQKRGFL